MKPISTEKIERLSQFLEQNNIDVLLIADWENARDVNMRYLSGHPMDATLVFTQSAETCLAPWDIQLSEEHAEVDEVRDFRNYKNRHSDAAIQYIKEQSTNEKPVIGVIDKIPYKFIIEIQKKIPEALIFKEPKLVSNFLRELRATKSDNELKKIRKAAEIGNKTIKDIKQFAAEESEGTENDLSFLVMRKMKEYGAEGNSFESLVANTDRSHMIHCHPFASNAKFSKQGLALIDYGALYEGYPSDITIPFTFGELKPEQKKIRDTVLQAYEAAIEAIDLDVPLWKISKTAVKVIEEAGFKMPHSLGHGLGLTVHDSPAVREKPEDPVELESWEEVVVENGMVFTIEPGVYVKGLGGLRLENDVIIKNGKVEVITNSHLVEL
jgi:Xaa-Pro dipeptidase